MEFSISVACNILADKIGDKLGATSPIQAYTYITLHSFLLQRRETAQISQ